jgi:uncharacterized coiled-coil protein SlyX
MMNKSRIDEWRSGVESRLEELTIFSAKQNSDIEYIKKSTDEIKKLVKEQNGRVRTLEQKTSAMQAVTSVMGIVFAGLIGWLFKIKV